MLDAMHAAGELEAIDVQIGRLMLRSAADIPPAGAQLLAASAARARGTADLCV